MDLSLIIPWIPKLAATLLIILGILIFFEIRAMIRRKNIASPTAPEQEPVEVTKVRFPDTGIHTEAIHQSKGPIAYKKLFIIVPVIVIALFTAIHFLSGRVNTPTDIEPSIAPTPVPAEIFIYRLGTAGDLELLNYDELKKLEPSTEILIAVTAEPNVQKAVFTVNGESIDANIQDRTPNGELFIDYVLKPGVVDYYISVSLE